MTRVPAALMAMALATALSAPAFARDRCVFLCGTETDAAPAEARGLLAIDLGAPLPAGMQVVGYVEGGFQDRIVEVRLHGTRAAADAMLALLGHSMADLDAGTFEMRAVIARDWWDLGSPTPLLHIETHGPHLEYLTIGILPDPSDPDLVTVYLLGFNT